MRIEITKGLVLLTQTNRDNSKLQTLFPAGEYDANLTSDGNIEVVSKEKISAYFSFSQFREKVSQGEFVVVEN